MKRKHPKPDPSAPDERAAAQSRLIVFGNDGRETSLANYLLFGALLRR